jgi:MHS family shikimate/dehydroshikimate transporter-like MFS transporter
MESASNPPTGPDTTTTELDTPGERKMTRLAGASILATALEWFDFLIYSTASALVFGHVFFPSLDGALGTIASFGTLAVGFIARPVGGIIAGALGDKFGRKGPLVASMIVMGLATSSIGLLPSYDTIGIWAPILLVTARLIQGLGVGAQWGRCHAAADRALTAEASRILRLPRPAGHRCRHHHRQCVLPVHPAVRR